MIKGVIFDLGSTLIHTEHGLNWPKAFDRMRADLLAHLQAAGFALDPHEFLARFSAKVQEFNLQRQTDWAEYTTTWILTSTLEELHAPAPAPELLERAISAFYAYSERLWQPTPGLHPALQRLSAAGLRLGLISNAADEQNVQRLIDGFGLRGYFDPIIISAAVGVRKPNPRIFDFVLRPWGLPPEAVVMVGDTLGADILGAQLAGLHNVWVTAHAGHPANQAHHGNILPEAEIDAVAALPSLLAAWGVAT